VMRSIMIEPYTAHSGRVLSRRHDLRGAVLNQIEKTRQDRRLGSNGNFKYLHEI
jgi:hypothetical protein